MTFTFLIFMEDSLEESRFGVPLDEMIQRVREVKEGEVLLMTGEMKRSLPTGNFGWFCWEWTGSAWLEKHFYSDVEDEYPTSLESIPTELVYIIAQLLEWKEEE